MENMTPKQDIDLLVGVSGGGAIDGESGKLMASQIESIVNSLNSDSNAKKRSINFSANKKQLVSSIKAELNKINTSNSPADKMLLQINEIKISNEAKASLQQEIQNVLKTAMSISGGDSIFEELTKEVKLLDESLRSVASVIDSIRWPAKENISSIISNTYQKAFNKATTPQEHAEIATISKEYDEWLLKIEKARKANQLLDESVRQTLLDEGMLIAERAKNIFKTQEDARKAAKSNSSGLGIDAVTGDIKSSLKTAMKGATDTDRDDINQISKDYDAWLAKVDEAKKKHQLADDAISKTLLDEGKLISERAKAAVKAQKDAEKCEESLKRINSLYRQMQNYLDGNTRARETDEYKQIELYTSKLKTALDNGMLISEKDLNDMSNDFDTIRSKLKATGKDGKSLGDALTKAYSKFGGWMIVTRSLIAAARGFVSLLGYVKDVDSAMTELKKVTNETSDTYNKFLDNAAVRAKKYGATLADTVSSTADFSRLGYALPDAEAMANAAIVYKSVGDGIESISEASESIISTMQAFNEFAGKPMEIIDRYNEVGNNFAISSKGIGDAMMRSAAALASANNTIDESIALVTSANEVVQDPDKTGTTLKTISMFLRSSKTEAEEAGIETEGMVESVSKLREDLLGLTGGRVDIQIDDSTFKSTYQILKEISEVWDSLTDVTQANILEKLGGRICRDVQ